MGWAFAWDTPEGDASAVQERAQRAVRVGTWGATLLGLAFATWFLLYATGLFTTLGSAEGSENHDRFGVRTSSGSGMGLPSMYLLAGQRAWVDYELVTEGDGGGILVTIADWVPHRDGVLIRRLTATGQGRIELVAPRAGFYSFAHEYLPLGGAFGRGPAGATRYALSWGVD
jgi:hypothetical protein